MHFKQIFLPFFFLLFVLQIQAQKIDNAQIDKLVSSNVEGVAPGLAVGIVKDGTIIYEQYLGYANLEHEVKVDEKTRFNIASNAKQFTALCILQLIEQGKISLEDDFRKYLPDLYPNIQEKITISNLITHTSGIRDYCDLLGLQGKTWWKQFIDNEDVIELLEAQRDLNFKPGAEYLYSNSNYILLAAIIKKVTAQDFSAFAKNMFEALAMPNTSFFTHYGEIVPNRAKPYGNWSVWREEPTITEVHGDGALFTTLKDQLQWEQIVQQNNGKYLSQKLINESQSLIENPIENNYGYGLFFDSYKGLNLIHHDGVTGAYNATFLRFPMEKISIVVMSNNRNGSANYLAMQIAKIIFDKDDLLYPGNPDKIEKLVSLQDLLGNYQHKDGTIIKIKEKDGFVYREMYQRDAIKLINEQGALFEYETIEDLKMNFTNIGQAEQQFTIYKSSQEPSTYYKLPKSDLDAFNKSELNGHFYNDETDTEIIIKYIEGNTYSITKNGRERKAELVLEDYLRMMAFFHIKIIRGKENKVIGLNVERDRIKNVIFIKGIVQNDQIIRSEKQAKNGFVTSLATADGGKMIVSTIGGSCDKAKQNILLTKNNLEGNEEWYKVYGGSSYDRASSLIATKDGGYLIVGSTSSFGAGNYDVYIIKVNAKGEEEWSKTYGGELNEYGFIVEEEASGYLIKGTKQICGDKVDFTDCKEEMWSIMIDKSGKRKFKQ